MTATRTWLEIFKRGEGHPARGGWAESLGGVRLARVDEGLAVLEMEMDERHHQPNGVVQGGSITALADAARGVAMMSVQEVGWANTTIELKVNFIRPVVRGLTRAEARVIRAGKTVLFGEAEVHNSEGKLCAKVTSSCLAFKMPPREHAREEVS